MSFAIPRGLLLAVVFGMMVGCGPRVEKPIRHEVAGTVHVGGKLLDAGTVIFNPTDASEQGGPVQASVQAGKYSAKVASGKWRVTFTAGGPVGAGSSDAPGKLTGPVIPTRYRDGVEVDITGPHSAMNFDLKSK